MIDVGFWPVASFRFQQQQRLFCSKADINFGALRYGFMSARPGRASIRGSIIRLFIHHEFIVARGRATDGNRLLASRAIAGGASTGNGNTELTLISQST
jgi:hypothetical protein